MSDKNKTFENDMANLSKKLKEKEQEKKQEKKQEKEQEIKEDTDNSIENDSIENNSIKKPPEEVSDEAALSDIRDALGGPSRELTFKSMYIAEEQDKILKYIAENTEKSQAEMVRMALDLLFETLGL